MIEATGMHGRAAFATADMVVVGGGIAGLVASCRAAELGLSVVVLEKGGEDKYPCNTRWTGGAFHFAFRDVTLGKERLLGAVAELGVDASSNKRVGVIIEEGERAVRWLQQQGIRFVKAGQYEYQNWLLAPPRRQQAGPDWEGRGGDVLLRTLEARLSALGGKIHRATKATGLLTEQGCCVGVAAEHAGQQRDYRAGAVVIADGGFGASQDLLRQNVSREPGRIQQRNAGSAQGDGLRMVEQLGAAPVGISKLGTRFYGHVLSAEALTNPQLTPFPFLDALVTAGIIVNTDGVRFVDEGLGGVFIANTLAGLDDPASALAIFDQAIWQGPAAEKNIPPNPNLIKGGGSFLSADTIEALAKLAGVPAESLQRTVSDYNKALATNGTASLAPGRSVDKIKALPISTGPFHAVRLCAGITYTMGGIAIDENSRVLRADGAPIPGLFAAGCTTGGLEGGEKVVYFGGLMMSSVTALVAAERIAQAAKVH